MWSTVNQKRVDYMMSANNKDGPVPQRVALVAQYVFFAMSDLGFVDPRIASNPRGGFEMYYSKLRTYITIMNEYPLYEMSFIGDTKIPDVATVGTYTTVSDIINKVHTFLDQSAVSCKYL